MDSQPYMYAPTNYDDVANRYPSSPSKPFDPKAFTRASWEPASPRKPKPEGPLVSFGQHPDALVVPEPRKQYKIPGPRTKAWIKGLRIVQLCFRILQLIAAAGILFLFIIIDDVSSLTTWILRITSGVVMIHCAYAIFHLVRPAGARPPASSAGYQTFASVTDLAVLPLYAYGCLSVRNSSAQWGTLLQNESLMNYFIPSLFYTLFAGVAIHLVSLVIGLWLALKFRQIANLPPDMNPLEDNLTSRHRKGLSMATTSTYQSVGGTVPLEERRRSAMTFDDEAERPPSVPFHATRSSPRSSFGSGDLPHRQYQVEAGNSPRNSMTAGDMKRMSAPPPSSSHSSITPAPPLRSPWRNSHAAYDQVATNDLTEFLPPYGRGSFQHTPPASRGQSRPGTANTARGPPQPAHDNGPPSPSQPRPARFTEVYTATESLFNRTHAKNRATMPEGAGPGAYEAIRRRYDLSDSDSNSDNETETATALSVAGYSVLSPPATEIDYGSDLGAYSPNHPNPLRSNPSLPSIAGTNSSVGVPKQAGRRAKTPFVPTSTPLSEIDLNDRRIAGSNTNNDVDIADEKPSYGGFALPKKNSLRGAASSKRHTWAPRDRNSSIQPEGDFYSKPYGDLRASTPPMIVGADRQVSSGNDYDLGGMGGGQAAKRYFSFKRNVSGAVVEEGRALGYAH